MKKHVLAAISAVVALVLAVMLSFTLVMPSDSANAAAQSVNCQVQGHKDGNTIYVTGSGACEGLSFNFDVNDAAGSGNGAVNIGLPTEVVTEFVTQTATVTLAPTSGPKPSILPVCSAETLKKSVRVTCTLLGKKILNVNLPISLPTIKIPPGRMPETVTVTARPRATQTVTRYGLTVYRDIRSTETVTVEAVSTSVVTQTVGQEPTQRDRIAPDNEDKPDPIDFGDGETTIVEAGLGALSLFGLVALLLLALYGGYVLGWKDKESKDTDFIGALLDQSKLRR